MAAQRRGICRKALLVRNAGEHSLFDALFTGRRFGSLDFDAALEVGAVFDAEARGGDVADHFAVFLDLDAIAHADIAHGLAVDHNFAGIDLGIQLSAASDGEPVIEQGNGTFDLAIDLQIFVAGDFTLDGKRGPDTGQVTCRGDG